MRDIRRYEQEYFRAGFETRMVRLRRRRVLEILSTCAHASVLEAGCGLDSLAFHLEGWNRFVICEPSPAFCAEALRRGDGRPGLSVVQGFLEESVDRLRGDRYDVIVAGSLLHEVEDPRRFLRAILDLCAAETLVHINVPNSASLHVLLGVAMGLVASPSESSQLAKRFQRTSTFDRESLSRLVGDCGFQVLSSGGYFLKPFTHAQMEKMLEVGLISEAVLDALYEVGKGEFAEHAAEIFVNVRRRDGT